MTSSEWNWRAPDSPGVWGHGPVWARPFAAAAPWVAFALLCATFALVGGRLVAAPGVVFDLPAGVIAESDRPGLVALAMCLPRDVAAGDDVVVFFDDARYVLSDPVSREALGSRFEERAASDRGDTLLLLADRRVGAGDLMRLVALARESGIKRVQIAEKGD